MTKSRKCPYFVNILKNNSRVPNNFNELLINIDAISTCTWNIFNITNLNNLTRRMFLIFNNFSNNLLMPINFNGLLIDIHTVPTFTRNIFSITNLNDKIKKNVPNF